MDKMEMTEERETQACEQVFDIGAVSQETQGVPPVVHESGSVQPGPFGA